MQKPNIFNDLERFHSRKFVILKVLYIKFVFLKDLAEILSKKAPIRFGAFFILSFQYKGWVELVRHAIRLVWRGFCGIWA
jgi:hypothetical protein